jgi:putative Mg2+ transporter-C (MgtC) family protein
MLIDLLLSVVLGFLIGFERKLRGKEAGIRTHTIVCFGAALIMMVSKYGFSDSVNFDASRVAAQIVSGVGFLGAGIIVYRKSEVLGLTTAAGVWATAGVGMACGAELHLLAIGAAALLILVQCVFHLNAFHPKQMFSIKIVFLQEGDNHLKVKKIFSVNRFNQLLIERSDGKTVYSATLRTSGEFSSSELTQIMNENDFILSIERCDHTGE